MNRKILVIVEGERKEIRLISRLKELFLPQNISIASYGTSLYQLYDYLEEYCDFNFEDLDVLLALKAHETDENKKAIFDEKYTDVLLIFDFDPQDDKFDITKISKLMSYFNDSTENGKLYINYPMVESFYHLSNIREIQVDEYFIDSKFTVKELKEHKYKSRAVSEGTDLDIGRMSKEMIENIMYQQSCKANYILEENYEILDDYGQEKMIMILDKQNNLLNETGEAYVLNTCSFFVLEFYPSNVDFLNNITNNQGDLL
ncbi:MAG: hypothetical protein IJA40_00280 [Phascolarctobacterium sp.]|nr:hypothetical protein [Phascolarctobacterium sp.]